MKNFFIKFWLLLLVAFCLGVFPGRVFAADWASIGFETKNVKTFYVNPNNNQKMLVSLYGSEDAGKIYVSENGGEEWSRVSMDPGTGYCNRFIKSPNKYNEFWAACSTGIFHSTDNAKTFKKITGNAPRTVIDNVLISKSGLIFAVYLNTISYSSDGIFWNNITLPGKSSYINVFLDVNTSKLYVSKQGDVSKSPGLYRSSDNGISWEKLDGKESSLSGLNSMVFFKSNSEKICATNLNGFACSNNSGLTWSSFKPLRPGVDHENNYFYTAIQNPEDEDNLIVLAGGMYSASKKIYYLSNKEIIWKSESAPDYSSNISISTGDIFVWSPNASWLKGVWKAGGVATTPEYQKKHPVIVVPGLLGSYHDPLHPLSGLQLDPIFNTYDGLLEVLGKNGFEKDKMLFTFPYNWRNDNLKTAKLLKQKIDEVKGITGAKKVDIVAHSMGGLVTRSYAQSDYYENDIDQIIFLGTPQMGASKAYIIWEAGDVKFGMGIQGITLDYVLTKEAKFNGYSGDSALLNYIHNEVKSVQQLLPIFNYLKFNNGTNFLNYPNLYPKNIFLENLDKTKNLLSKRYIRTLNIVGNTGEDTINSFVLDTNSNNKYPYWNEGEPLNYYNKDNSAGIVYSDGDGTVPLISNQTFLSANIVLKNVSHGDLPNKASDKVLEELGVEINKTCPIDSVKEALIFVAYSPINFYIEAPDGKKIGTNIENSGYYDQIEGAFYSGNEQGEAEFVVIPNPKSGQYKIVTIGTGVGDFEIRSIYGNDNIHKYFQNSYLGTTYKEKISEQNIYLDIKSGCISAIDKVNSIDENVNDSIEKNDNNLSARITSEANVVVISNDSNQQNNKEVLGSYVENISNTTELKCPFYKIKEVKLEHNYSFYENLKKLIIKLILFVKNFL